MDIKTAIANWKETNITQKRKADNQLRDYIGALVQLSKQAVPFFDRYGKMQGKAIRQTINGMAIDEAISKAKEGLS